MLLEAAEVLRAGHLKVGDIRNDSADLEQMTEEFSLLCRQARVRGTDVLFELLPPTLSRIPSLDQVLALVRGAGEPNAGIMLDNLHLVRTGITNAELLAKLTPQDKLGVEINDGLMTLETTLRDAVVNKRLLPGDGEFDITGFLDTVSTLGYQGPVAVEVLNEDLRKRTLDEAATQAWAKTRAAVDKVRWR
jgi:sugar phosphate isomerase/epimerase